MEKVIFTVFAGRQNNIEILHKYLQKMLNLKLIDEVHYWNYTRNRADELYMNSISNLKKTSSKDAGKYFEIFTSIINNSFNINVMAKNDIHIKIYDGEIEYEIVIGGWSNTKSVIRENNIEIYSLLKNDICKENEFINIKVLCYNNNINIYINNELIIECPHKNNFQINNIYIKTGHNSIGKLKYKEIKNNNFYLMDPCIKKPWDSYYNYYTDNEFHNDIIIKCDDDIVFIDINKFKKFIDFRKKSDADLIFANIINNGVSAYIQQNIFNLIPKDLMELEYPSHDFSNTISDNPRFKGHCGTLWGNGKKAEDLHNYFINNYEKFLNNEYFDKIINIDSRFSINFFAYKGNMWYKIKDCGYDDETYLTIDYRINKNLKNIFYSDFYVSHLTFGPQENYMNLNDLRKKYSQLFDDLYSHI